MSDALHRRVMNMVARGIVRLLDDTGDIQTVQLDLLADETSNPLERHQDYGFTSAPHAGAEAVPVFVGGLRSHGLVVAVSDRRYRLTGLSAGEVAIYDDLGQVVRLTRSGIVITTPLDLTITSAGEVAITAQSATVTADSLDLGAAGGPAVARVGDAVSGGVITSGSAKVRAA